MRRVFAAAGVIAVPLFVLGACRTSATRSSDATPTPDGASSGSAVGAIDGAPGSPSARASDTGVLDTDTGSSPLTDTGPAQDGPMADTGVLDTDAGSGLRGGGAPTQTRIVDNFEQLGIDTQAPRFAWVVNDTARAEVQTAYQIIVAADEGAITANQGTLWDSGQVASAQQYGVPYAGPALTKTRKYWWKVRTWNRENQGSAWSNASTFVTGFFQATDWDRGVQWIRHPQAASAATDVPVIFRKSFSIHKPVKHAFLYVTGLGQFVASLNGHKVGDHEIDPAWTDYDHTVSYVTFDVTQNIVAGANALGISLGSGWLNAKDSMAVRPFGVMRMLAQLHVENSDGTSFELASDPTWKASTSPFLFTEIHGVEKYDARLEQAGWNTAAFDDSAWPNAAAAMPPAGVLFAQSAPPVRAHEVLSGVNVFNPAADTFVFDFGRNTNSQFEITANGQAGATLSLSPGEFLNADGTVNPGRSAASTYTLKGGGLEVWRLTFSTIGMRYLQVRGASRNAGQTGLPYIQDAKAYVTYTASNDVGTFATSDARYNKIYDLARGTLQSNLTSLHTDGPNYEKLGWQEVVWTTLSSSAYQQDVLNLFTKITRDIRDTQRTYGLCPDIAPNWFHSNSTPSQGIYDDAPAWGSSIIQVPWLIYSIYGDTRILQENYATMKAYVAYLKTREVKGLVAYGLGDWMAPAGTAVANIEGAVYVHDIGVLRDVATVLENSADAAFFASEFARAQTAYNNAYFDSANKRYMPVSQANMALPIEFGIVPAGSEQSVAAALVKDIAQPVETTVGNFGAVQANHITAGDVGTTFLWRALGDFGQADLVQTMIMQPRAPSYLSMISGGETTIAENWNFPATRSHNHDMYAGILEWLYRSLGGISSTKPGYAECQLKPGMPAGLANVSASYDSVRGPITSAWNRILLGTIQWKLSVPVNSTAKVYLPTFATPIGAVTIDESGTTIFKNGAAAASAPGVTFDHVDGVGPQSFVVFAVGSGTYQFVWNAQ